MNPRTNVSVGQNGKGSALPDAGGIGNYLGPEADIYETPDAYVLVVDLPGATRESIVVGVDSGNLTVQAGVQPRVTENATMLYREIRTAGYFRIFRLGEGVDQSAISAEYDLGVLTVKLPKSAEGRPREILIR